MPVRACSTTVAGNHGAVAGDSGDGGPATSAQLESLYGLAIDNAGDLYLPDADDNVVRKVTASTGIITTIAGQSSVDAGYAGDGGLATSALLNDPEGVALDAAGNVYIADSSNLVIRKINAQSGIITTAAGVYNGGEDAYGGDGGAANLAGLSYLEDVAVDGGGNFYIADSDNNVIRSVTVASGVAAFGSFAVGSSSPAIDVTLVNDGNTALHLSALSLPANFNLGGANTSCTPTSVLTSGETCILGIEFLAHDNRIARRQPHGDRQCREQRRFQPGGCLERDGNGSRRQPVDAVEYSGHGSAGRQPGDGRSVG